MGDGLGLSEQSAGCAEFGWKGVGSMALRVVCKLCMRWGEGVGVMALRAVRRLRTSCVPYYTGGTTVDKGSACSRPYPRESYAADSDAHLNGRSQLTKETNGENRLRIHSTTQESFTTSVWFRS